MDAGLAVGVRRARANSLAPKLRARLLLNLISLYNRTESVVRASIKQLNFTVLTVRSYEESHDKFISICPSLFCRR